VLVVEACEVSVVFLVEVLSVLGYVFCFFLKITIKGNFLKKCCNGKEFFFLIVLNLGCNPPGVLMLPQLLICQEGGILSIILVVRQLTLTGLMPCTSKSLGKKSTVVF